MHFQPALLLLGLFASAFALPYPSLVGRAKIPGNGVQCDGKTFSADVIRQTISESHTTRVVGVNRKEFPHVYKNLNSVFPNINNAITELWIQPLDDPVWVGQSAPGRYRVVMNHNFVYVGVMAHPPGDSTNFRQCTPIPDTQAPVPPNVEPPHIEPPVLPGGKA